MEVSLKSIRKLLRIALFYMLFACSGIASAQSGSPYFDPEVTFKFDGENPYSGVIADFNADDIDDIAAVFPVLDKITGAIIGSRINFLIGNVTANMKVEGTLTLPFNVQSMATGDFNGDGEPDLAVASLKDNGDEDDLCGTDEGITIFIGSHKEVEPVMTFTECLTSVPTGDLLVFDANLDGLDDLAVGDHLMLSNGDGSFYEGDLLPAGDKNPIDINGDGYMDVVTLDKTECGNANGFFDACPALPSFPLVPTDAEGMIVTTGQYSVYSGTSSMRNHAVWPAALQPSADLNNDGVDDLMGWAVSSLLVPTETYWRSCGWRMTTVRSFHKRAGSGRGSGYYRTRRMYLYSCSTSTHAISGWEQVTYSLNRVIPNSTVLRATLISQNGSQQQIDSMQVPGVIRTMQLTDVDGDGNVDALAQVGKSNNAGEILGHPDYPGWTLFPGNGDGTFGEPQTSSLAAEARIPGDFNGDGFTDFGWYVTPFDSEHLVSVNFHVPMATTEPAPVPDLVPTTDPAPDTGSTATPMGETVELEGEVTAVGNGYFAMDGQRIEITGDSTIKFNDGAGPTIQVGDAVQGKADEYSDGSLVAVKFEFGG